MTLIEIENTFAELTLQLESLARLYPNTAISEQVEKLQTEAQIIKLKIMRMLCSNDTEKQQFKRVIDQSITHLQLRITQLYTLLKIETFDA